MPPLSAPIELAITSLGAMADGVGEHEGKPVYVPFTCAGDVVKAAILRENKEDIRAKLLSVLTPSPDRQAPVCTHYGRCGGCSLQHLNEQTYEAFKQRILGSFVAGIGADNAVVAPMVAIKQQSRRRADFKIETRNEAIRIGFYARGSHQMVDVSECPISDDSLIRILPALREVIGGLKKPGRLLSISLTAFDNGLDATIKLSSAIGTADKERLVAFAQNSNIIRLHTQEQPKRESRKQPLAQNPVCLYDEGNATIRFAGIEVSLPSGAFLQATQAGQDAITALVTEHLSGCDTIADLYSGCGTYSFPLIAQAGRVSAYEGAAEMAAAMNDACVANGLDERIETTMRDLFADPLSAEELKPFDGIVINPPRNGALPQVEAIGQSGAKKVVYVSCDPATFKRDGKALMAAGYALTLAVPIDQFYWSRHLELVAVFEKKEKAA